MADKKMISLALSQEELLVILSYLQIQGMIGLNLESFDGKSKKEMDIAFKVAERALVARGFLGSMSEKLQLNPAVVALIGACAAPEKSLVMTHDRPGHASESLYFHSSRRMKVIHAIPVSSIHQFIAVDSNTALLQPVFSVLNLGTKKRSLYPSSISLERKTVTQARKAGQEKGVDGVLRILKKANLEDDIAAKLALAIAKPLAISTLTFFQHKEQKNRGFSILNDQENLWLFSPVASDNEMVFIRTEAPDGIREAVQALASF